MTAWKINVRTAPGALVAAEYHCPVHGRFALDVPRDANGDPPSSATCPAGVRWELAGAGDELQGWRCAPAPFVISAPGIAKVRRVEAVRGKSQQAEFETWTDTTNLGEGQDIDDWKDDRAKVWEREREREAMELAREL
jgi:hypothetical protein